MITETITIAASIILIWHLNKRSKLLESSLKTAESKIKSLYVLHGHAVEKLAPFSKQFKGDMKEITFVGNPLDYIGFHKDSITFYEIKSGQSQLSSKQKAIRKLIENKQVNFEELRL